MVSEPWLVLAAACLAYSLAAQTSIAADTAAAAAPAAASPDGAAKASKFEGVMKDPNRKVGFIRKTITLANSTERCYQIWVPLDYTPDKKWPVILFLHGAGERGTDGEKVLTQGLPKEITKRQGQFEFIVVIPQCAGEFGPPRSPAAKQPATNAKDTAKKSSAQDAAKNGLEKPRPRGGWVGPDEEIAMQALRATLRDYSTDPERIYLTGLSMGGFGTFIFAMKYPTQWAAAVPICGGGDTTQVSLIADIPIWVWHGDADKTVPVDASRKMVAALKEAGAKEVKYTELPGVGHNSWDAAYASDDLWKWLLEHRRPAK
jgi:predicted peptidase